VKVPNYNCFQSDTSADAGGVVFVQNQRQLFHASKRLKRWHRSWIPGFLEQRIDVKPRSSDNMYAVLKICLTPSPRCASHHEFEIFTKIFRFSDRFHQTEGIDRARRVCFANANLFPFFILKKIVHALNNQVQNGDAASKVATRKIFHQGIFPWALLLFACFRPCFCATASKHLGSLEKPNPPEKRKKKKKKTG